MLWTEAIGREVVNTSTAEVVGRIDGFVVEPTRSRLTGVVVGQRVVQWDDAGGVGSDAVTLAEAGMLRPADSDLERSAVDGDTEMLGRRVLTEGGRALGDVSDVDFDPDTGVIERLHLGERSLDGADLLGVGTFAVVVSDAGGGGATSDLESMTKDELYEMAQSRDIGGRSTMNKDELIEALR